MEVMSVCCCLELQKECVTNDEDRVSLDYILYMLGYARIEVVSANNPCSNSYPSCRYEDDDKSDIAMKKNASPAESHTAASCLNAVELQQRDLR